MVYKMLKNYSNIMSFHLLSLLRAASCATSLTSKKTLKLLKYISKWCTTFSISSLKAFKAREATIASLSSKSSFKRTSGSCLLLFISSHTCLIIYSSLWFITESLICFIYCSKFIFCRWGFINIGMELLCKLKVRFLYFIFGCIFAKSELFIKIPSV